MPRPFDWISFLQEHRIHYVTSGANVKRGEINIKCPWCGSADPSQHMGLNLETGWFSCWRNRAQHSGKSPLRLIMALLRVPYQRAREIAGLGVGYVDPEGFDALAARLLRQEGMTGRPAEVRRCRLMMDAQFRPIQPRGATRRAYDYLRDERRFDGASAAGEDVDVLCELYGLRMGAGDFAERIVIPYVMDSELVTWTARAIGPSRIRYRDLSIKESILPAKETLFNHDALYSEGGLVLLVVEGPFDALKADFYGEPFGVRAVAMSTNTLTDAQAFLLQGAIGRFECVLIVLDNKTGFGMVDSMRMKQTLAFLGDTVSTESVPYGAGDIGELTPREATEWAQTLVETRHF